MNLESTYKREHRIVFISCRYDPLFSSYPPFFRLLPPLIAPFYFYLKCIYLNIRPSNEKEHDGCLSADHLSEALSKKIRIKLQEFWCKVTV